MRRLLRKITHSCTFTKKVTKPDDYQITAFLGQGSTSRVFQGFNVITKKEVIIKLFKDIPEEKIQREIRINQAIKECHNIIPLLDVIQDPCSKCYGMIFENFKGVTLNFLIGKMEENKGIQYVAQILKALEDIHAQEIVHCDLKPSNILITKDGAKLFDFGLAKMVGIDSMKIRRFGTKCYYTPQVMFAMPKYDRKVDIWVMGLILAEIVCKRKPLMPYSSDQETRRQLVRFCGYNPHITNDKSLQKISRVNWYQYMSNTNQKMIKLINSMLSIDPNDRPQASQILQHDIFKSLQS